MSLLLNVLWFIAVIAMNGHKVKTYSLPGRSNVSNSSEDYGYYNIYSKIDSLQKAVKTLESSVQRKNNLLRQVLQTITEMDDTMEMSDQSLLGMETHHMKPENDTSVGFTTKLHGTFNSAIIKGSEILLNQGNAYNGTVFTCPSSGLYLFHVSMITASKAVGIYIYKNSQKLTIAWSGGDPEHNSASTSAAVMLDVGDQVYLRSYSTVNLDHNSAFTGVKVN